MVAVFPWANCAYAADFFNQTSEHDDKVQGIPSLNSYTVTFDLRFYGLTWGNRFVVRKNQPTIFQRFFSTEATGASVLVVSGVVALLLANSRLADAYQRL
jgi:hypothetical protein